MLFLATLSAVFLLFLTGYTLPRKSGLFLIGVLPIASGMTGVTLIPALQMPLTIDRAMFIMAFGILASVYGKGSSYLMGVFSHGFIRVFLLFSLGLIISSARDSLNYTLFFYLPDMFTALILGFIFIRTETDLLALFRIFAWSAFIIGFFALIEYFTLFNPTVYLQELTNPNYNYSTTYIGGNLLTRAGYYRVGGLDGFPVFTGVKLAFLLPFTIWYILKNKPLGILTFVFAAIGLILVQTRAAIGGLIVGFAVLGLKSPKHFAKTILAPGIVLVLLSFLATQPFEIFSAFWRNSFMQIINGTAVDERTWSIPLAFNFLNSKPITGFGSPLYVYDTIMDWGDMPAPLLYGVSGGFPLLILYLSWTLYMPMKTFVISLRKNLCQYQRLYLNLAFVALTAGIVPISTQWAERHFPLMLLLLAGLLNVFSSNGKPPGNEILHSADAD